MIYFSCPKCNARLSADPVRVGQAAICGKCQGQVTVPKPPMAVRIDPSPTGVNYPTPPPAIPMPHATTPLHPSSRKGWWWYPRTAEQKIWLGIVAFVIGLMCIGILGEESYRAKVMRTYDRQELKAILKDIPIEQVRDEIGAPDDIQLGSVMLGWEPSGVWYYSPGVTSDPTTGKRDPSTVIFYARGRVVSVSCSAEETAHWFKK